MNAKQVQKYVMRYLEATGCQVIEKSPAHVTVKLSVEADKALTGRHYYWSFVERTGAPPETMAYSFIFDPDKMNAAEKPAQANAGGPAATAVQPQQDTILGRYFGVTGPATPAGRIPREEVAFGSRRLEQLFAAAESRGRCVRLFEERLTDGAGGRAIRPSAGYATWLGVNFKVELACDLKRDELHSLGINLSTGEVRESFMSLMLARKLTPKLPANIFLQPTSISLARANTILENILFAKLKAIDHGWADDASERLAEELVRIDDYYVDMLKSLEGEQKEQAETQYRNRQQEIEWQHRPRIQISAVNCGLFHLNADMMPRTDAAR